MNRLKALWHRLGVGGFWRRMSEGLTLQELWTQFRKETGASYRLYTVELDAKLEGQPQWKRWPKLATAVFWALLSKLSPARRIFLLLALLLVVLWNREPGRVVVGALALLVLLALELADRVAMKRDLEIAREIQTWLVPRVPPSVAGADIAFTTRPANTVAGDYYDAFLRTVALDEGPAQRLLLVVTDVAGKGMPAALLMATFQASLWTLAKAGIPLAELADRLNLYCCEHSLEGRRFTTTFIAELDPVTGTLRYTNAGHDRPVLRRASGEICRLEMGGLPLGIQADAQYESGSAILGRGDLLVIYTDGVVEAQNEQGEDYGETRLLECLRLSPQASAAECLEHLMASVVSFVGSASRHDDITCLVVRYAGG